jgi:hypothetical protein
MFGWIDIVLFGEKMTWKPLLPLDFVGWISGSVELSL